MRIASLFVFIFTIIISIYLLPQLPDRMLMTPVFDQEAGSEMWSNKYVGIFITPFIMGMIYAFLVFLERLKRNNKSGTLSNSLDDFSVVVKRVKYNYNNKRVPWGESLDNISLGNLYLLKLLIMLALAAIQLSILFNNLGVSV